MHVAPERHTWSQCKWLLFFLFPAQVRAMSLTNWAEVPGGKGLTSIVSKLETTAYPALLFPSKTKLLPSVYQIYSGLVRGSSGNPSQGFVQWSKVSRQDRKGKEPSGVRRRLAGLRTSQRDIVRPGFSISTTWYLRILWSDIHMASSIWELFHLVAGKIVCPRESFKVSSIMTAIAARFHRQGKIFSQ